MVWGGIIDTVLTGIIIDLIIVSLHPSAVWEINWTLYVPELTNVKVGFWLFEKVYEVVASEYDQLDEVPVGLVWLIKFIMGEQESTVKVKLLMGLGKTTTWVVKEVVHKYPGELLSIWTV